MQKCRDGHWTHKLYNYPYLLANPQVLLLSFCVAQAIAEYDSESHIMPKPCLESVYQHLLGGKFSDEQATMFTTEQKIEKYLGIWASCLTL